MARRDASKVKDKSKGRNPNVPLREDGPAKPPKTLFKRSALHGIRHPGTGMKRLFRPGTQSKQMQSPRLNNGTLSDYTRDSKPFNNDLRGTAPQSALSSLLLGYQPTNTPGTASGMDETEESSFHDEQSEVLGAKKAPLPDAQSRRSNSVGGRGDPLAGLVSKTLNSPNMVLNEDIISAPDMSDDGSAPTQILIMSRSSETVPETFQESLSEAQTDSGLSSGSDHKHIHDILDLIEMYNFPKHLEYTSSRDMSRLLDEMPGQVTVNDRRSLQRSLTPFLGSPSSYIEILAEATSSAKGRTGLSRFYVSAWIFRSVTESRLDGLRFSFVVHLAVFTLPKVQRIAFVSKPAKLAQLAKSTWYSDATTYTTQTNTVKVPASSDRTMKSIFEATASPTSSLFTDLSSLPDQHRTRQNAFSKVVSRMEPAASASATSDNRKHSSLRTEMQPYNVYRNAKSYLGGTGELLADGLLGVWMWLDPPRNINILQSVFKKEAGAEKERRVAESKGDNEIAEDDTESLTEWFDLSLPEHDQLEGGTEVFKTVSAHEYSSSQPQQNVLAKLYKNVVNLATTFVRR